MECLDGSHVPCGRAACHSLQPDFESPQIKSGPWIEGRIISTDYPDFADYAEDYADFSCRLYLVEAVEGKLINIARYFGVALVIAGWGLSLYFFFQPGEEILSLPLEVILVGWISAPFMALLLIEKKLFHRPPQTRLRIYALMEGVAILSAIAYSGLLGAENKPATTLFFLIPALSIGLIALAYMSLRRMKPPQT